MFSLQFRKILASRLMRPLAMLAIAALAAPGSAMAASQWASVGSTGIVDESCYLAVQMDNVEARLVPGLLFPCKIRYQVTDTFGGMLTNNLALYAHIRDTNVTPGHVVVNMFSYNRTTGVRSPAPLATIDSNSLTPPITPVAMGFTEYKSAGCPIAPALNFTTFSYWIEVDLIPGAVPALPGLAIASVQLRTC